MALMQLVYVSRPFGFDESVLNGILWTARYNNARDDITGCLICRADMYLQLVEGPEAAVAILWAKLRTDDRHLEVTRRVFRPITDRMFPSWAMRDDPAQSWMWTQDEVDAGAIEKASDADLLDVFVRVKAGLG